MRGYRRSRPGLGTLLTVSVDDAGLDVGLGVEAAVRSAFDLAESLESVFSRFDARSTVGRFNALPVGSSLPACDVFSSLLRHALDLWQASEGAFNPFFPETPAAGRPPLVASQGRVEKRSPCRLDLNGIAKGDVAERMALSLAHALPRAVGRVNAGGDVAAFPGIDASTVLLRVGRWQSGLAREARLTKRSVATTAVSQSVADPHSASRYSRRLRRGLTPEHSVTAFANRGWAADALTKVALYAPPCVVERCARELDAQIWVFDPGGELVETYGHHEVRPAV